MRETNDSICILVRNHDVLIPQNFPNGMFHLLQTVWLLCEFPLWSKLLNYISKVLHAWNFKVFCKMTQKSHYDVLRNMLDNNSLMPLMGILNRFTLQQCKFERGSVRVIPLHWSVMASFPCNPMWWRNHPFNVIGLSISVLPQSFI